MNTSGDIVTISSTDTESPTPNIDKPLMQLLERLIGNDNKQNTVLTNAQIVEILLLEFEIDIIDLHELEVEIYLNIMKRFLKDWPQWDEFDKNMKEVKEQGNKKMLRKLLISKYNSLKSYLKLILETSKPMAKETVNNVIEKTAGQVQKPKIDTSDIVMEIQCSRSQLNQLFFRTPHPSYQNTIFNVSENEPSRIIVNTPTIKSMLNWWDVSMTVNIKGLTYTREIKHNLKHVLVNKKLKPENTESNALSQDLEFKVQKSFSKVQKRVIINFINHFLKSRKNIFLPSGMIEIYTTVISIIKKDLERLPDVIDVPGTYRQYASKYKYKRYLYKDVTIAADDSKYDLQLEETLSPLYKYSIVKYDLNTYGKSPVTLERMIFNIECGLCAEKFEGLQPFDLLKDHFMSHQSEPDWQCTNCNSLLSMTLLSSQNWTHECPSLSVKN